MERAPSSCSSLLIGAVPPAVFGKHLDDTNSIVSLGSFDGASVWLSICAGLCDNFGQEKLRVTSQNSANVSFTTNGRDNWKEAFENMTRWGNDFGDLQVAVWTSHVFWLSRRVCSLASQALPAVGTCGWLSACGFSGSLALASTIRLLQAQVGKKKSLCLLSVTPLSLTILAFFFVPDAAKKPAPCPAEVSEFLCCCVCCYARDGLA
jgi:hypothetical protein